MSRREAPLSPQAMARLGWSREGSGLHARWSHPSGWRLVHCGHPTAHHPWAFYAPSGAMICTGVVGPYQRPDFGTAWNTLRDAVAWLDEHLAGRAPMAGDS